MIQSMHGDPAGSRPLAVDHQRLNPVDVAMLCVDRELRSIGYSGFQTQMLLWLSGRVDGEHLRSAIAWLSRRYPIMSARIVERDAAAGNVPYWQFRRDEKCPLYEMQLPSDDRQAVLDAAGGLLSVPCDPVASDPIRFYLLHRPSGRDVFIAQYNHTLMDNSASLHLVRQIDNFGQADEDQAETPRPHPGKLLHRYQQRFSRERRRKAAQQAIKIHGHMLRGRAIMLSAAAENVTQSKGLRIVTRTLSPEQSQMIQQRSTAICGFPSLSMALLASVFRAIDRLTPVRRPDAGYFSAGIGIDLGLRKNGTPLLGNWMSLTPVWVGQERLGDRDQLVRRLSLQMREHLASDVDLGVLSLASVFSRKPRHIRWVVSHLLRYNYSLWYAFFGSLDSLGERFCGAEIEEAFYTGPAWSPVGITLLANQHRGRLLLQATYVPEVASPSMVDEYLNLIVADVLA